MPASTPRQRVRFAFTPLPCRLLMSLGMALVGAACSDSTAPPATRQIASISLSVPAAMARSLGQRIAVSATMVDAAGAEIVKSLAWTTSDDGVVSVNQGGVVTTVGSGTATVTASGDGVSGSVAITVRQELTALTLSGADTVFTTGVRVRIRAVATDSLGSPYVRTPLEWLSDAPAVVSVEPGLALPVAEGTARITVRGDGLERTHALTVIDAIDLEVPGSLAEGFQWAVEDTALANGAIGTSATIYVPGVGTWTGVYGRSNPTEVIRPDMLFYPGSIVKSFVTAAVLSVVDDGTLSLDSTIGDWLAPFGHDNIPGGVTLRQLLLGTSGITDFQNHPALGDSLGADRDRVWSTREVMEKFVPPPEFEPGTSWRASLSGYMLAGLMAEAATSRTIVQLVRERVFDGMGLREASTQYYEEPPTTVADTWTGGPGEPLRSAASLQTTTIHTVLTPQVVIGSPALATFTRTLFGSFISPTLRSQMTAPTPVMQPPWSHQTGAGLGLGRYDFLGRTQWGHSGSQGTGSGFFLWDESSGIVISVLHNQSGGSHNSSHFGLVPGLLELALQALTP